MTDVHGPPDIPCVILAGGGSRRFGTPKGLAQLGGKPLIQHTVDRLRPQTSGDILVNCALDGAYTDFGLDVLPDRIAGGLGPLAGIHAAMVYARKWELGRVLTAPVDTPFLPGNLISQLSDVGAPSVAATKGRIHGVCGLWPVSRLPDLETQLSGDERSVKDWVKSCGAHIFEFPVDPFDPFFNINTPEDMVKGSQYLLQSR